MSYPPPAQPPQPPPYQPPPTQPMQQPVVKSKAGPIVAIILGILLLICLVCAGGFAYFTWWANDKANEIIDSIPTDFPTAAQNKTGPHKVRYEVTGTGEATITWAKGGGGQGVETVKLPWSVEITVNRDSFGAQVIAVPRGEGTQLDSCRLEVDGAERKTVKFTSKTLNCSYTHVS